MSDALKRLVDSSILLQALVRIEMAAFWWYFDRLKHLRDRKRLNDTTVLKGKGGCKRENRKTAKKAAASCKYSKTATKPASDTSARKRGQKTRHDLRQSQKVRQARAEQANAVMHRARGWIPATETAPELPGRIKCERSILYGVAPSNIR